jgi:hypothetical protein
MHIVYEFFVFLWGNSVVPLDRKNFSLKSWYLVVSVATVWGVSKKTQRAKEAYPVQGRENEKGAAGQEFDWWFVVVKLSDVDEVPINLKNRFQVVEEVSNLKAYQVLLWHFHRFLILLFIVDLDLLLHSNRLKLKDCLSKNTRSKRLTTPLNFDIYRYHDVWICDVLLATEWYAKLHIFLRLAFLLDLLGVTSILNLVPDRLP